MRRNKKKRRTRKTKRKRDGESREGSVRKGCLNLRRRGERDKPKKMRGGKEKCARRKTRSKMIRVSLSHLLLGEV